MSIERWLIGVALIIGLAVGYLIARSRRHGRPSERPDEGHQILIAANGEQGLEALMRERPGLVFLDYMMPVMDGAELLQRCNNSCGWRRGSGAPGAACWRACCRVLADCTF